MKLRHRLAIYFALAASALLVVSRLVTLASFTRVQQYELDRGLRARAEQEGNAVALMGRRALEAKYQEENGSEQLPDPLEQLVTYGALYQGSGDLVADTLSFSHAPSLADLGVPSPGTARLGVCFDFLFRGETLRGVLVEVKGTPDREYLLLATSRRDMDGDARQLLRVGWWVTAAAIPLSLAVGWWFGRRTTRGITALAASARQVAAGDLDVVFDSAGSGDEEVVALAGTMREMVGRLKTLLETERRFASHAAHELRSPLAVLRGELELALRRPRTGGEYEVFLRDALDDTIRLTDLAEDLLVVARAGTAPRKDTVVELTELVEEAIAASRAGTPHAPAVAVTGDTGRIVGVRADLVRMVRNLVDNALEHRHGVGDVRVHVEIADGAASIVVENDGPGIGDDDRDRIFEHFHRGADARAISGAGLGLGIAREVAARHGGTLVLERPRSPTRFVVRVRTA